MTRPSPAPEAIFDDAWLRLREPTDHLARDAQLTLALDGWVQRQSRRITRQPAHQLTHQLAHQTTQLVDLGCGSGSNPRYLAPRLKGPQRWRLLDHDAALLSHTAQRCAPLTSADGHALTWEPREISLATAWSTAIAGADVATASALFDLLTPQDVETLAQACAAERCAVLFVLSVDGDIQFYDRTGTPCGDDDDRFALDALSAHQQRDKGDGPAMGTQAPQRLRESFSRRGYQIREAPSPWRLGEETSALAETLMAGWRDALHEQLPHDQARINRWVGARLASLAKGELTLNVGHRDLLALPPGDAV